MAETTQEQPSAALADVPAQGRGNLLREEITAIGPAVRRFLYGMCGDWHEAEDLAQDALLKAWAKRDSYNGAAQVKTWVFTIARNTFRDRLRRRKVRPEEHDMAEAQHTADPVAPPARSLARAELSAALDRAMETLPDEQREALALRESEQMTFREIGLLLNVPTATVKSRVRYALLKLAEQLQNHGPEDVL